MAISVFLSYSSKDAATARQLESDLERGRVSVWRDTELRGGDLWWQKILEQIRACDVFVLALSNNGLASKPCRAELTYARDLGLPVLPVQIGPVDSLRTAAVGELQVIEYRHESGASGIALFAEIEEAARRRRPLPDPLPPAPPVPFAYLLRLGSAIEKEQLTPAEQGDLVGQLRDCLDTEDDEGVKDDAQELLRALRRRPDVTFKHAGEIDLLLAGVPKPRSAEQPTRSVPTPAGAGSSSSGSGSSAAGARRATAPGATAVSGMGATGYPPRGGYSSPPPGYGAPPPPGYGTPPPRVPVYPAAGTGYYGAPAPAPKKRNRAPMFVLIGAVVVALLVVGGVIVFGGSDPPPEQTPAEQLLAILPGDIDPGACSEQALAGDGDLAALACGPGLTQPGPAATVFRLYPAGAVNGVFRTDMANNAVPEFAPGQECPGATGYGSYTEGAEARGQVACWVGSDNAANLAWTEDEFGTEALATIPDGGDAGVSILWDWWTVPNNSSFGR